MPKVAEPTIDDAIDRIKLLQEAVQRRTSRQLEAIDWAITELKELKHGRAPSGDLADALKARKAKP